MLSKESAQLSTRVKENYLLGALDGEGAKVGTAGFYRGQIAKKRPKGWVWGVFVSPAYRGEGVGRALLAKQR